MKSFAKPTDGAIRMSARGLRNVSVLSFRYETEFMRNKLLREAQRVSRDVRKLTLSREAKVKRPNLALLQKQQTIRLREAHAGGKMSWARNHSPLFRCMDRRGRSIPSWETNSRKPIPVFTFECILNETKGIGPAEHMKSGDIMVPLAPAE